MTLTTNIAQMRAEIACAAYAAARQRQAATLLRLIAEAPKGGA